MANKLAFCGMFVLFMFLLGCSAGKNPDGAPTGDALTTADEYKGGPVELFLYNNGTQMTKEELDNVITPIVKAKYPQISLRIETETDSMTLKKLDELIAAGDKPDMILTSSAYLNRLIPTNLLTDINPTIQRYKIDLGRMEPTVIDDLRKLGGNTGAIYGLPFGQNFGALFYNKDLFDKFAVPYPSDSMTWDDMLALAKRMTRTDQGTQYYGMTISSIPNMLKQSGASNYDSKDATKAVLTSEAHKRVYNLASQLFQIPGFVDYQKKVYFHNGTGEFFQTGIVAMLPNYIAKSYFNSKPTVSWDLTRYPVFPDRPNNGTNVDFHLMAVSKTSDHKEAADRVMLSLTSDEGQLALTKTGRFTILRDRKIRESFGADTGFFQGKKLEEALKISPSPVPDYSLYNVNDYINEAVKDIALNGADVNTALRQAEEKANQAIRAQIGK
jgi:multiple sugar transport system substrate-binding protein